MMASVAEQGPDRAQGSGEVYKQLYTELLRSILPKHDSDQADVHQF